MYERRITSVSKSMPRVRRSARTLKTGCYCEAQYGKPLRELLTVNVRTVFVLVKQALCGNLVRIYLPTADTFTVSSFVFDESNDIRNGIAQKDADFMRKFTVVFQAV